jgi:AraC-like DNA-binding protein
MSEPTVMASLAASLVAFAAPSGADRARLLQAAALAPEDLADPDGRLAVSRYARLIGAAIEATGDEALLLRHAAATTVDALSIVGLVVDGSETIDDWIAQLNQYAALIADVQGATEDRFKLVEEGAHLWLVDHFPGANDTPGAIEDTFARIVASFRAFAPDRPFVTAIELSYPRPSYADVYDEIFRVPVRFASARNALRIADDWRGRRLGPSQAYARRLFRAHADALLGALRDAATVRGRLERWMVSALPSGGVSVEAGARGLGMSRQTLYRRLKEEGCTFAGVHDDLRRRLAEDLLGVRQLPVEVVARELGFAESSSFVPAFRRWTGTSPGAFRDGGVQ